MLFLGPDREAEGIHCGRSKQTDPVFDVEKRPLKTLAGLAAASFRIHIVGANQVEPVLVNGEELDFMAPGIVDAVPRQIEFATFQTQQGRGLYALEFKVFVFEVLNPFVAKQQWAFIL